MDLAGPKIRTGALEPGPAVVKFRPAPRCLRPRRRAGSCVAVRRGAATTVADAGRCVAAGARRHGSASSSPAIGSSLVDARGAARHLRVVAVDAEGCWPSRRRPATSSQARRSVSIDRRRRRRRRTRDERRCAAVAGACHQSPRRRRAGRDPARRAGRNAVRNERGQVLTPARDRLHGRTGLRGRPHRRSHLVRRRPHRRRRRTVRTGSAARADHAHAAARRAIWDRKKASISPTRRFVFPPSPTRIGKTSPSSAAHADLVGVVLRQHRRRRPGAAGASGAAGRATAGDRAQDRDAARLRESAGDAARGDEELRGAPS